MEVPRHESRICGSPKQSHESRIRQSGQYHTTVESRVRQSGQYHTTVESRVRQSGQYHITLESRVRLTWYQSPALNLVVPIDCEILKYRTKNF